MPRSNVMTVSRLIKRLQELEQEGHGRSHVLVSTLTLDTGNGTFDCCTIHKVTADVINIADGDGFHVENKDGSERLQRCVLLRGRWHDEHA